MSRTHYVEPTGLSERNVSSANDLVKLIRASRQYPLIQQFSTTDEKTVAFRKPNYTLGFRNTNALVRKNNWDIQLSKTGFTNAAGHCLVMSTTMKQRPVAFVVLDAFGKYTHMADANRLKKWLETGTVTPVPAAALAYKQQKQAQRQLAGQPADAAQAPAGNPLNPALAARRSGTRREPDENRRAFLSLRNSFPRVVPIMNAIRNCAPSSRR